MEPGTLLCVGSNVSQAGRLVRMPALMRSLREATVGLAFGVGTRHDALGCWDVIAERLD